MSYPVPPELNAAIEQTCIIYAAYGLPQDLLRGIWLKETGGNYPNPYVNPQGYGGLFGTTLWSAPTQTQSNYAGSILVHLHAVYGDWRTALYHYSGGGYSTLPGGFDLFMALTDAEQQELLNTTRIIHEGLFGQDPSVLVPPMQDTLASVKVDTVAIRAAIGSGGGGGVEPPEPTKVTLHVPAFDVPGTLS